MIKALENFTYYLDNRPVQVYSGQVVSFPEGDETYLIETGKAEEYAVGGGSSDRFVVTFSENDGAYSCDKTLEETLEACESGRIIEGQISITGDYEDIPHLVTLHQNGFLNEPGDEYCMFIGFETEAMDDSVLGCLLVYSAVMYDDGNGDAVEFNKRKVTFDSTT